MTLEEKINNYQPSDTAVKKLQSIPLVLLASVVAGGKDTVTKAMVGQGGYTRFLTNTTRSPRANEGVLEQQGVDYNFINLETAEAMVDGHEFIEVKYVHGNVYGSTIAEFERVAETGSIPIGDVDVHGVDEYLAIKKDVKAIFLLPPSVDTWLSRLRLRYGNLDDHASEIKVRFQTAYDEIRHVQADKRYVMVINDDLATTVERIQRIVDGSKDETSEYAEAVTEHLLDFLDSYLRQSA